MPKTIKHRTIQRMRSAIAEAHVIKPECGLLDDEEYPRWYKVHCRASLPCFKHSRIILDLIELLDWRWRYLAHMRRVGAKYDLPYRKRCAGIRDGSDLGIGWPDISDRTMPDN